MEKVAALVLISTVFFRSAVHGNVINLVFLTEAVQKNMSADVNATLKDIEQFKFNSKVNPILLEVADTIESDVEELCSTGLDIVVVDLTYDGRTQGLGILRRVPYIRVNLFISPILNAFGAFLKEKLANDVAMIFESEQDTEEALHHIIRGFPFRVVIINAAADNMVQRMKSLRPSPSYVAIFAKGSNMNTIFEKINRGKLFVRPSEWHFVFLDARDKAFKYRKMVEYATKFTMNAKLLCRALRMKDTYCVSGFKLQKAVLVELIRSILEFYETDRSGLRHELNCSSSNTTAVSHDLIGNIKSTEFLTVEDDHITFTLNMSINSYSNDHDAVTEIATWQKGGLTKLNETISPAKRFFRIGTAESIPWSYHRRDPRTGKISFDRDGKPIWEGYCIDFIQTLSEYMNFDYEIVPPTRGLFGQRHPNGSWDGVVGDLVVGETDFAVAALKMTSEREEVIDFIAPYFEQTGISIVIRKAVRQTSLFKFMTVLRLEVWLSIVAALVATALMIWLLDKYSPYSARNNKSAYPYPCRDFTLKESFWFALTSFTPQGGGEAPKAISGRILVAAYWLFVVLMLATFTANLAAFLTVERMQTPVQSLEQLARQSRINYTVVEGSDTHEYFINMKYAEDTLYRLWKELSLNATRDQSRYRIWDYPIKEQYGHILLAINSSIPVKNAADGFRKVNEHENADFAFIHDSAELKYEITKNCNLSEVGEVFAEQPYAIAVQQGSHLSVWQNKAFHLNRIVRSPLLQDELSYAILELQKDRYFEGLSAKYWNHSLNRECSQAEDQEGITLESLGGVFIATLFGLALAMITLVAEVVYYRKKDKEAGQRLAPIKEVVPIATVAGITPPPPFEVATFRGKKIPEKITLGNEFKPVKKKKKERMDHFAGRSKNEAPMYCD